MNALREMEVDGVALGSRFAFYLSTVGLKSKLYVGLGGFCTFCLLCGCFRYWTLFQDGRQAFENVGNRNHMMNVLRFLSTWIQMQLLNGFCFLSISQRWDDFFSWSRRLVKQLQTLGSHELDHVYRVGGCWLLISGMKRDFYPLAITLYTGA